MTDLTEYIGIPFGYGGRDRSKLDCYGLVMLLYKELHNTDLPDVNSPSFIADIADLVKAELLRWEPCDLEPGCIIIFSIKGYGCHVGYYLGNDRMIHTWEGTGGVCIERLGFSWSHRILGTYKWNPK